MMVGFITTYDISAYHRSGEVYSIQQYVMKFVSELRQVNGFLRVPRFPLSIKLTPRYNSNIVESGFKYHKQTKPSLYLRKLP
jgi:hypothetical protein